jgi:hypothetical protein
MMLIKADKNSEAVKASGGLIRPQLVYPMQSEYSSRPYDRAQQPPQRHAVEAGCPLRHNVSGSS